MSPAEKARRARHARFMEEYYMARYAWWRAYEHATALYPAEVAEYKQQYPPVTFKQWLIQTRGQPR